MLDFSEVQEIEINILSEITILLKRTKSQFLPGALNRPIAASDTQRKSDP